MSEPTETKPNPSEDARWLVSNGAYGLAIGGPAPTELSNGYLRALDLARDAVARPHSTYPSDLLTAACRDVASGMVVIANEDGDALVLASLLQLMVTDTARRENREERNR